MCDILVYKVEMTRSAFKSFVQAHLRMTYTQMIGTTDFPECE